VLIERMAEQGQGVAGPSSPANHKLKPPLPGTVHLKSTEVDTMIHFLQS
jgi:hypothetical protein